MNQNHCYHNIRMMGPNPPPCLECEIQWHTDTLKWLTKAAERNSKKLAELLEKRAAFEAAMTAPCPTAPLENPTNSEQKQPSTPTPPGGRT